MNYVLCLIFDYSKKNILLIKNNPDKELYPNKYNAIGGKIEQFEFSNEAGIREIYEETNIKKEEIFKSNYLMYIDYDSNVCLYVYYYILKEDVNVDLSHNSEEGTLLWMNTNEVLNIQDDRFAGEGNLAYFVNYALIKEK